MPWKTTRVWVETVRCLRCERELEYRGRRRKWCDECRIYARVGNAMRNALRELDGVGGADAEEARVAIAEIRERMNLGEDLFPLDGAMSTAEFAMRGRGAEIPREEWPQLRSLRGAGAAR